MSIVWKFAINVNENNNANKMVVKIRMGKKMKRPKLSIADLFGLKCKWITEIKSEENKWNEKGRYLY